MPYDKEMFLQAFARPLTTQVLPSSVVPGITAEVLRADLIDPLVSGNKWFKLRYYLDEALSSGKPIVTFGGAWSNHILATAIACNRLGIPCSGIIRGEEPPAYSTTLTCARDAGMELVFVSRTQYAAKITPSRFARGHHLLIPEGGSGETGVRGAETMTRHVHGDYTHCLCAVGTGTMMAGLILGLNPSTKIIGIPVLKDPEGLTASINRMLAKAVHNADSPDAAPTWANWELIDGYTFGGYAKHKPGLLSFMNDLYRDTGIPTDFVYTGKLFYAGFDLMGKGIIPAGSRVLLIHSGGLQGNAGLPNGTLMF